jgi:hypothetical protein
MNILIPLADGRVIASETIKSIAMQTVDCNIVAISRPAGLGSEILQAQCYNMNLLKKYASTPYTFYMDNDVVLSSKTDIEDCTNFLGDHAEFDAVALDTKGGNIRKREAMGHVVIAATLIRSSFLENYSFFSNGNACQCVDFNIRAKVKYLDDRRLTEIRR